MALMGTNILLENFNRVTDLQKEESTNLRGKNYKSALSAAL
jgi:hypothetical protein